MNSVYRTLLAMAVLAACQKQLPDNPDADKGSLTATKNSAQVNICHKAGNSWHMIATNHHACSAHQAHGDIILNDADHDGYVPVNPCGFGQMGDCDDTNAGIHPGAAEICGNGIDENCNGQTDENCFASVTICDQVWMTKNLDVTTYRNGDPIPQVTDVSTWVTQTSGAWTWYNDNSGNGTVYGKLYNWYAVNDPRGLAPAGWHIPTDAEWTVLGNCLGGAQAAGGSLKEEGNAHWLFPNNDATNSSGFTGLPGGYCGTPMPPQFQFYQGLGTTGMFWTSTPLGASNAYSRYLVNGLGSLQRTSPTMNVGASVRLVKD